MTKQESVKRVKFTKDYYYRPSAEYRKTYFFKAGTTKPVTKECAALAVEGGYGTLVEKKKSVED